MLQQLHPLIAQQVWSGAHTLLARQANSALYRQECWEWTSQEAHLPDERQVDIVANFQSSRLCFWLIISHDLWKAGLGS